MQQAKFFPAFSPSSMQ